MMYKGMVFLLVLILASYNMSAATTISGGAAGGGAPVNTIIAINTGVCGDLTPGTWAEVTALRGRYPVGMPASGTLAGTLGSAMTDQADASYTPIGTNGTSTVTPLGTNGTVAFTPAGTNGTAAFTPAGTNGTAAFTPAGTNSAPTFSGSALAGHAHEVAFLLDGAALRTGNSLFGGGSTSLSFSHTVTMSTSSVNNTGQLSSSVSGGTPAGTVTAPTFTGNSGTVPAQVFTGNSGTVPAQVFTGNSGTVPAQVFTGSSSTVGAQTFTGTASTTMRSVIAPTYQMIYCRKTG